MSRRAFHARFSRLAPLFLVAALLALPFGGAARAGDERDEDVKEEDLVMQIFHVGGLTSGRIDYIGERPPPVGPQDVTDEDRPLFGSEAEEPVYPVGQVDELIELTQGFVEPRSWEVIPGAYVRSMGENAIVVRSTPRVIAAVARYLADLERRMLEMATVEVRAFRENPDVSGPQAREPGPSVSLTGFTSERVSAFSGKRYAYVQGYRAEVAQGASASDPVVSVANLGLGVDARILPSGGHRRLSVDLDVRLADIAAARRVGVGANRSVDAPAFQLVTVRTTAELKAGTWTRLSGHAGGDGWVFEARVTPHDPAVAIAPTSSFSIERGTDKAFETRMIDVRDLNSPVPSVRAGGEDPSPSNFTPPEPAEMPEPCGRVPADALAELIFNASRNEVWDDPAALEVRNGRLIMRNVPSVLAATQETVDRLRREFLWSLTTRVEVLKMPPALLEELRLGAGGGFVLSAAQRERLDAALRDGKARRTDILDLVGRSGARNGIRAGRHVGYVRDYDVSIAQEADLSAPRMGRLFSGLSLGVTPYLATGGKHVVLDVRFRQSSQPTEMERAETPAGPVELPRMDVFRVRCGVAVPLGASVLFGTSGAGREDTVLLLTPTLRASR